MAYKNSSDQKEYARRHYLANKELYKSRARIATPDIIKRNQEYVNAKKAHPCVDCGNTFHPVAMDFDHVLPGKIDNISRLVRDGASIKRIQAEIDKCELVCSNCHRVRTLLRRISPTVEASDSSSE